MINDMFPWTFDIINVIIICDVLLIPLIHVLYITFNRHILLSFV